MTIFLRGGRTVADPTHLAELLKGVESWNRWRAANPQLKHPDLTRADFTSDNVKATQVYCPNDKLGTDVNLEKANLKGASLKEANFERVNLFGADLTGAWLKGAGFQKAKLHRANLQNSKLNDANFERASLEAANLQEANLVMANFQAADLVRADLQSANLLMANLNGANLRGANMEGSNVTNVRFFRGSRQRNFQGIRVATCYGNQIFKSFAQDQDYIETLRATGTWGEVKFWIWYIFADCGRSFLRWGLWSVGIAVLFGLVYFWMGPEHIKVDSPLPFSWLTMMYYSVVTFTTLGFGDIKPATETAAMVVMLEVILGYIMLGGLVAILANKVARRS
jgi:uncharacterized protein YjbI with pentapeptide repeats